MSTLIATGVVQIYILFAKTKMSGCKLLKGS